MRITRNLISLYALAVFGEKEGLDYFETYNKVKEILTNNKKEFGSMNDREKIDFVINNL